MSDEIDQIASRVVTAEAQLAAAEKILGRREAEYAEALGRLAKAEEERDRLVAALADDGDGAATRKALVRASSEAEVLRLELGGNPYLVEDPFGTEKRAPLTGRAAKVKEAHQAASGARAALASFQAAERHARKLEGCRAWLAVDQEVRAFIADAERRKAVIADKLIRPFATAADLELPSAVVVEHALGIERSDPRIFAAPVATPAEPPPFATVDDFDEDDKDRLAWACATLGRQVFQAALIDVGAPGLWELHELAGLRQSAGDERTPRVGLDGRMLGTLKRNMPRVLNVALKRGYAFNAERARALRTDWQATRSVTQSKPSLDIEGVDA